MIFAAATEELKEEKKESGSKMMLLNRLRGKDKEQAGAATQQKQDQAAPGMPINFETFEKDIPGLKRLKTGLWSEPRLWPLIKI